MAINRTRLALFPAVIFCLGVAGLSAQNASQPAPTPQTTQLNDRYVLGEDSLAKRDVPAGTVSAFTLEDSNTYPGYSHRWWLYVPPRYDGKTPVAPMVFQEGGRFVEREGTWRVPVVLANLMFRHELPLMAAVFVDPGQPIRPTPMSSEQRSYEYDTLSAQYARFLIEEILPEVKTRVRVSPTIQTVAQLRGEAAAESAPLPLRGNDLISSGKSFRPLEASSTFAVAVPILTSSAKAC